MELNDLIKPEDLAAELQVTVRTLANMRSRREGPPFVRVGRSIRYSRRACEAWLAGRQGDTGRKTA